MHHANWFASAFVLVAILLSAGELVAGDPEDVLAVSRELEAAALADDVAKIRELVLPTALSIHDSSGDSSLVVADLISLAKPQANDDSEKFDTSVVHRDAQIHGDTAIVLEWLRVHSTTDSLPPMRRSLVWTRQSDDTWKLAHTHASPYLRWESAISEYEAADRVSPPAHGGVVFVGSSSVRLWKNLASDFADMPVINRGFGGSEMIDSVLYARRIVTRHRPAVVVVYAGDNDIGKGKNAERVLADFQQLVSVVHQELPDTTIGFIAIKPSLKRWEKWPEMKRANELVRDFAQSHTKVDYLDIATPMLGDDGRPRDALFVSDGLHLSDQGYAVWTAVIRPWLAAFSLPNRATGDSAADSPPGRQ
jgi:lysophospholipase L1-like esterase/ketosteroid isomerase-like protein